MTGTVFDIQHFCTGDGPGIRTTVFLKGCTLHCPWCHNPESQSFRPEILLNKMRCIGCAACDSVCPAGDAKGTLASAASRVAVCDAAACRACADNCPSGCLEVAGRRVSSEDVMREVLQDEAYYRQSGGGMTLSGGEPMAQPAFSRSLLEAAKSAGLRTCLPAGFRLASTSSRWRERFRGASRIWRWRPLRQAGARSCSPRRSRSRRSYTCSYRQA